MNPRNTALKNAERLQTWTQVTIAPEGTHHLFEGIPLYADRFDRVLKFHAPGLAPVARGGQAWHIHLDGSPAYQRRFRQTFGFYEGLAAVVSEEGWHHILPDGSDHTPARYAWCGNYQGGRCTVRGKDGRYFHLAEDGKPAYSARWRYAGDFRDGAAVVQDDKGRSTHIDVTGSRIHGRWFHDLDVYHKGFARARDARGWTHVDPAGRPVHGGRFAAVEPFYNGQARVERFDGGLEVIDENGETLVVLRDAAPGPAYADGKLGDWPVGDPIHRGSSGAIYASAPGVLIKSTSNPNAWQREMEILTRLAGQGAPRLIDAFTRATTGYLVLEEVRGKVLGGRNQTTPRPVSASVAFIRSLLHTLGRLHDQGWVHTDIHPKNVLDRQGHAILLDAAFAIRLDSTGRWSGEVHWGRWEFVPPEQFEGFTTLDATADTYAACGLLVYLLSGRAPFLVDVASLRPNGWDAVRAAFLETRQTLPLNRVPPALRDTVARGLSPNRARRFQSADAMLEALEVIDG